jgi:hypothetical protein
MKALRLICAAVVLAAVAITPAAAGARDKPVIRFFSGAQSHSNWTSPESSDQNRMSFIQKVGLGGYGIIDLLGAEGDAAPEQEPSFWFKADRNHASSGASPRLQVVFANGTIGDLRPTDWETNWRKVGGEGDTEWDVRGGPCGFRYNTDYEEVVTCADGSLVLDAAVHSDSWWLHGEYTNWVDQLQWDGYVYSHARDNNNAPPLPAPAQ